MESHATPRPHFSSSNSSISGRALALFTLALICAIAPQAVAQNAKNGQTLYEFACLGCHTPDPRTAPDPYNKIMMAANNPAEIKVAYLNNPTEMGFIPDLFTASDLADIAAYLGTLLSSTTKTVPVVEYYNAAQDHYVISTAPQEIADLDNGVHPGWKRTGLGFNAFDSAGNGASPVCRFYIPPEQGDSHFFSASPAECADVRAKFSSFVFEAPNVFYIALPDTVTGACPPGTVPVYRVWDNRVDSNHRYTASQSTRLRMQDAGWIAEGYGPDQVIMCSPQ